MQHDGQQCNDLPLASQRFSANGPKSARNGAAETPNMMRTGALHRGASADASRAGRSNGLLRNPIRCHPEPPCGEPACRRQGICIFLRFQ